MSSVIEPLPRSTDATLAPLVRRIPAVAWGLRRNEDRRRPAATALAEAGRSRRGPESGGDGRTLEACRADPLREQPHARHLRRGRRDSAAVAPRCAAAARFGRRLAPPGGGTDPAGAAARCRAGGLLRRAAPDAGRPPAGSAGAGQPAVPPAVSWRAGKRRSAPALLRGGRRARARRQLVGAQGSLRVPGGWRICAREPHRIAKLPAGRVRRQPGAAAGGLLPVGARRPHRADQPGRASHHRADGRTQCARVLRAFLPRALPGLRARGRRRPDGPRQPRVPQDARGAAPRGRDHPASRGRLVRPARVAQRLAARRARPGRGRARRDGQRRQRARQRAGRHREPDAVPAGALP